MLKRNVWLTLALMLVPVACVTINVYFPAAAAERAAEQFVDQVFGELPAAGKRDEEPVNPEPAPVPGPSPAAMLLDLAIPSAQAQEANISIRTPQIQAIQARMQQRFSETMSAQFESGALGLTRDGMVAVRDANAVPMAQRAAINKAVADENRDRAAVYREIAVANDHPEWEGQIRETFARQWIQRARSGWYYQDSGGAWQQK